MMLLLLLVIPLSLIQDIEEKYSYSSETDTSCTLEDNLSNWNLVEDSKLLNSFISLDTLKHQFNPRYGAYIHAIARVGVDDANNSTGIVVEDVRLYGDPFESDMFKAYFVSQYEAYVYALVDKYPIKKDYGVDECEFLIHQQKFRICG